MRSPDLADVPESFSERRAHGRVHIHYSFDIYELISVRDFAELRKLGGCHCYRLFADDMFSALEHFFALSIMQSIWARDIDALGRGGGELVKRGVYCTYPVLFCEFFSALARTRIYGEEFKIGRELQPVDKALDYPARADDG